MIPAGRIGNNRDLRVTNERWFSNEIQMLVKSVNSDPRFIAAVDALFQATSYTLPKKKSKRGRRLWLWLLGLGCLAALLAAAWKWLR